MRESLSSPGFPAISGDSVEFERIREIGENSGEFSGCCMALSSRIEWEVLGDFRGTARFSGIIWGLGWFRVVLGLTHKVLRKEPHRGFEIGSNNHGASRQN